MEDGDIGLTGNIDGYRRFISEETQVMTRGQQMAGHARSQIAGGSGDQNLHGLSNETKGRL